MSEKILLTTLKCIHFLDTGRKLNLHKALRKHPKQFLNIACTFIYVHLRPVSRGMKLIEALYSSMEVELVFVSVEVAVLAKGQEGLK